MYLQEFDEDNVIAYRDRISGPYAIDPETFILEPQRVIL